MYEYIYVCVYVYVRIYLRPSESTQCSLTTSLAQVRIRAGQVHRSPKVPVIPRLDAGHDDEESGNSIKSTTYVEVRTAH